MRSGLPIILPSEPLDVKVVKDIVAKHRYDKCGRTRAASRQRLGLPDRLPSYDPSDLVHNSISDFVPVAHDDGRACMGNQRVMKAHVLLGDGRQARLIQEVIAASNTAHTTVI